MMVLSFMSGCAERQTEPVYEPENFSVNIETFGVTAETEAEITRETIPEQEITSAPDTHEDETTQRSYVTDAPASVTQAPETSSEPAPDTEETYEISPADLNMLVIMSVNVRVLPDADSERVGYFDQGEVVRVTGAVSNGWMRVIYDGEERYVNGRYLEEYGGEPDVTEPPETEVYTTTSEPVTTAAATEPAVSESSFETEDYDDPPEVDAEPDIPSELPVSGYNSYTALNYPTQKAVWLAYLDLDDMLRGASEAEFRQRIANEFDSIAGLGCNTVYVHVRPFGDAYYYSAVYPFTEAYYGVLGVAPPYDPLSVMIEEAHQRGLSFHAWINPMRTTTTELYGKMDSSYALKQWYDSESTKGKLLVYDSSTKFWWLSPAYPAVRNLICSGVSEIVSRYNVDGIHIDDYFYPTTSASFDKDAFEASGMSDLTAFRKGVVSELVREIYYTVKSCNSTVLFGVSPQGNIDNNRNLLYADIDTWCSTPGYLDYIAPQIYFGFNDKLAFDDTADEWRKMTTAYGVKLICGIAAYKVGVNNEWSAGDILSRQTKYLKQAGYDGIAYYRSGSLFGSANSSESLMKNELSALRSVILEF